MAYYDLDKIGKQAFKDRKDIFLQTFGEEQMKVHYFSGEADWHIEERDEFFLVLDGDVDFSVEEANYRLKKGDLLVIEAGKRHRAHSPGVVMLSVEPHD